MKKTLLFAILALIMISPFIALAQSYVPLAPISNYVTNPVDISSSNSLSQYLNSMYALGIALCSALAVLMIVVGGIEYMSSDAMGKKTEGQDRINAALLGLLVALGSYVILKFVDPRLIGSNLNITSVLVTPIPIQVTNVGYNVGASGSDGTSPGDGSGDIADGTQSGTDFPTDGANGLPTDMNAYTLQQIQDSGILNLSPSDAAKYFPDGTVTAQGYVSLLANIANSESGFNPSDNTTAHSQDGSSNFSSEGLYSLSVGDNAVQGLAAKYGVTPQQIIDDPKYNTQAAIIILKNQISDTGSITGTQKNHYWGPLYRGE